MISHSILLRREEVPFDLSSLALSFFFIQYKKVKLKSMERGKRGLGCTSTQGIYKWGCLKSRKKEDKYSYKSDPKSENISKKESEETTKV